MSSEQNQTGEHWEGLYKGNLGIPRYASTDVVRWLFGNFSPAQASGIRLLDMGSGPGRHAMLMAAQGFQVAATDYSDAAIAQAATWAQSEGLNIDFSQAPAQNQPFEDQSFDGVLCYGVLYYLSHTLFAQAVKEIHRLLKPGGSTFVWVKNDKDVRKTKGESATPHQYKITQQDEGMPWNNETGMELTLLPKAEITACFSDFSDVQIEEVTSTLADGKYLEAAWLIYAKK